MVFTCRPSALGSMPVSKTAITAPLPSNSLCLAKNLSTPVSRFGTRVCTGKGSNSSMAGLLYHACANIILLVAPDDGK